MHVSRIKLTNFMRHDDTDVRMPDHGLVVVTGTNGCGKTSVIEAIATSLFGKTLRGATPWRPGTQGVAEIETDDLVVTRKVSRDGVVKLKWRLRDGPDGRDPFGTTTKAQTALESRVGDFESWARTSVFSSQDAVHFSTSTDAERKRFIEGFLGLDRFDRALALCRQELREKERSVLESRRARDVLNERVTRFREQLRDIEGQAPQDPGPRPTVETRDLEERQSRLNCMTAACAEEMDALQGSFRDVSRATGPAEADIKMARRDLLALERQDRCPTCKQKIGEELKAPLRDRLAKAEQAAEAARVRAEEAYGQIGDELRELEQERRALERKSQEIELQVGEVRRDFARWQQDKRQHEQWAAGKQKVRQQLKDATRELATGQALAHEIELDVQLLKAVERVLGLEGVRAHMLVRTLTGIEQVANAWLSRMTDGCMKIGLKPYSERKTGGVNDKIALKLEGAGGGHGYGAASGGERRRVDIVLLFALAEIAAAARGQTPGDLWLDEVLDTLDLDGIEALGSCIHEMARNRLIVVISHSSDVVDVLRPDLHLEVRDGSVRLAS